LGVKRGDIIEATLYVRFAKRECSQILDLEDEKFKKEEIIKKVKLIVD